MRYCSTEPVISPSTATKTQWTVRSAFQANDESGREVEEIEFLGDVCDESINLVHAGVLSLNAGLLHARERALVKGDQGGELCLVGPGAWVGRHRAEAVTVDAAEAVPRPLRLVRAWSRCREERTARWRLGRGCGHVRDDPKERKTPPLEPDTMWSRRA